MLFTAHCSLSPSASRLPIWSAPAEVVTLGHPALRRGGLLHRGLARNGAWRGVARYGLIGVLAVVSAAILALSGRYPDSVFDYVMG
jgi:hypothetical protein